MSTVRKVYAWHNEENWTPVRGWWYGREIEVYESSLSGERRVIFNTHEAARLDAFKEAVAQMTNEQKETLLALAADWHGTAEELVEVTKGLSK